MIGAIIGDIVGSRFEWQNYRKKDFTLFSNSCKLTDDSVMTLAVDQALTMAYKDMDGFSENAVKCMQQLGRKYPHCGFGGMFRHWVASDNPQPYNSFAAVLQ